MHITQAFNVLQPKSTVLKSNNENITLKVFNPKLDTKFNVEPYKPFSVVEQENRIFDQVSDENKPPVTNDDDDEVDHAIANTSIPGIRYDSVVFFLSLSLFSPPKSTEQKKTKRSRFEPDPAMNMKEKPRKTKQFIKTLPFLCS